MIVVIDTNVLISAVIVKESVPGRAVRKALLNDVVLRSESTTVELVGTLKKRKFERYFASEYEKDLSVHLLINHIKRIDVLHRVKICRDPKDDMYLELALSGNADCIVTGDKDLLALNPFRNIPIITPDEFLKKF